MNTRAASRVDGGSGGRWRISYALKVLLGGALVVGAAAATAYGAYRFALGSSRFALEKWKIQGGVRLTTERVAEATGIALGDNLFQLQLSAAEERLAEDDWVRTARLQRRLPDTLLVEVVEHEPAVLTEVSGQLFLVNSLGEAFKKWQLGDPFEMPVLTGVEETTWAQDRTGATRQLSQGVALVSQYSKLPESRKYPAQELHWDPSGAVTLTVGKQGLALQLGTGPWDQKMLMLGKVLKTFEHEKRVPAVVFLDNSLNPGRVVVRMR